MLSTCEDRALSYEAFPTIPRTNDLSYIDMTQIQFRHSHGQLRAQTQVSDRIHSSPQSTELFL